MILNCHSVSVRMIISCRSQMLGRSVCFMFLKKNLDFQITNHCYWSLKPGIRQAQSELLYWATVLSTVKCSLRHVYLKMLLHHLDFALFWTLFQSVLCKLEEDLHHLQTEFLFQSDVQSGDLIQDSRQRLSVLTLSLTTFFLFSESPYRP